MDNTDGDQNGDSESQTYMGSGRTSARSKHNGVYNIKWDGKGNRLKDKAWLVGKCYTQQLGIDYNKTWVGVTRLESVQMTAAVAAKYYLKLWHINFVGAYLNSLTKEDIYMKQPEGYIEPGYEDHICKLIHTIYGTMQGGT